MKNIRFRWKKTVLETFVRIQRSRIWQKNVLMRISYVQMLWHVGVEFKKVTSKASLENEKNDKNEAMAGKLAKNR